jgi:hypothetical protein
MAVISLVELLITVVAVVPIIFALLLLSSSSSRKRADGRRQPPSPPGLPLLGHLHLLGRLPHRALRSLAASHGPVMLLRLGRVPTVVASSAAAAEEAMKTRDLAFSGRPMLLMAQRLLYGGRDVGFAPYGEYWRQAPRVRTPPPRPAPHRLLPPRPGAGGGRAGRPRPPRGGGGRRGQPERLPHLLLQGHHLARGVRRRGLRARRRRGGREAKASVRRLPGAGPVVADAGVGWVDTLTGLEGKARRTFEALDGLLERVIADHRSRRSGGRQVLADGEVDDHRDFVDEMDKDAGLRLDTDNIKAIIMVRLRVAKPAGYTLVDRVIELHMDTGQDIFAAGTDTSSTPRCWDGPWRSSSTTRTRCGSSRTRSAAPPAA